MKAFALLIMMSGWAQAETIRFCETDWPIATKTVSCSIGPGAIIDFDLAPLARLKQLEELSISSGVLEFIATLRLKNVAVLSTLTRLRQLSIGHSTLDSIEPLLGLTQLTELSLHASAVADISKIGRLKRLETLDLSCTRVADVAALKGLPKLRKLTLTANKVRDIRPLFALKHLESLGVSSKDVPAAQISAIKASMPSLHVYEGRRY